MTSESPQLSSIIAWLISAFADGRQVFQRLVENRKTRKLRRKGFQTLNSKEKSLRDSLSNRPQQISNEYNAYLARLGQVFHRGDDISNASLAQILLTLNMGLSNIIQSSLDKGAKRRSSSVCSLLTLSETTSTETLRILSQLQDRVLRNHQNLRGTSSSGPIIPAGKKEVSSRKQFVRSKSASNVSIETAPGTVPTKTRPSKKRRHSTPSRSDNSAARNTSSGHGHRAHKKQDSSHRVPKRPLPSGGAGSKRQRPQSMHSFLSDSTKIGEIPEERWTAVRGPQIVSNDAERWQQSLVGPIDDDKTRRRFRLRFWKKD